MKSENKIQANETENQNDNFCRFDAVVMLRRKEYNKDYYAKKRDKILDKAKSRRENNIKEYRLRDKNQRIKNRQKRMEYGAEYRTTHKDAINLYRGRCRKELHDSYVRTLMAAKTNLKESEIPEELIEIKRLQLQLKREVRNANKIVG